MKKRLIFAANLLILSQLALVAQVQFSGYGEAFFQLDSWKKDAASRPNFLFSHNRADQVAVNLALVKAAHSAKKTRGNMALMVGTYAADNLAAEPALFQFVNEASVGVRLSEKENLWLDAGVFPSHVGYESAISKDCWALSRSMMAENSPYFESGAKLTWLSKNEKWTLSALALNGWQTIFQPSATQKMAVGSQIQWKNGSKTTLNWSSFFGQAADGSGVFGRRVFQNFYGIFQLTEKFGLTAGVDFGVQNPPLLRSKNWWTANVVAQQKFSKKWRGAARFEFFDDPDHGVIADSGRPFSTRGASANVDFLPEENVALRLEGRWLGGEFPFTSLGGIGPFEKNLFGSTLSLAVSF